MRILCVDDEPAALERLAEYIAEVRKDEEDIIYSFRDAHDALDEIKRNKLEIDIAFLDIEMIDINGLELAKYLKETNSDIKTVFVTGYDHYAIESYRMHVDGYILKPVTMDELRSNFEYLFPSKDKLDVYCFGNFDIKKDGLSLKFKRSKSKELLAYLIDRKGSSASTQECIGILFEDRYDKTTQRLFSTIVSDAKKTLKECGFEDFLINRYNSYSIDINKVNCDYYKAIEGNSKYKEQFIGEYMNQYSWAEGRSSEITKLFYKYMG